MEMKKMKLPPPKKSKLFAESMAGDKPPLYPWGLCITLDNETLKKLGVDKLPEIDQPVMIQAYAEVTAASMRNVQDGVDRTVTLQIMELGMEDTEDRPDEDEEKGEDKNQP